MKLAILAQGYLFDSCCSVNGTLVQLYNLSKAFSARGIEVHYIASTKDQHKLEYELIDNIYFYWLQESPSIISWRKLMPMYKAQLEKVNPDAVYVRGRNTMQYVAGTYAAEHEIPYIWGTNGEDSAEFWKNTKRLIKSVKPISRKLTLLPLKTWEDFYINLGMKLATKVVNQTRQQQVSTYKTLKKKGVVLPNYFLEKNKNVHKANTILWLASLSPSKQPELFLELIKSVDLRGFDAILGGGSQDKDYEKALLENAKVANVKAVGYIEYLDSIRYYQSSRLYINTSRAEADGLPNAFIQSWLCGVPVLALNHDPNGWIDEHNIGFCAHGDFSVFKAKLQECIDKPDLVDEMSTNAIKFAEATFSSESIINQYIELFVNEKIR